MDTVVVSVLDFNQLSRDQWDRFTYQIGISINGYQGDTREAYFFGGANGATWSFPCEPSRVDGLKESLLSASRAYGQEIQIVEGKREIIGKTYR